MSYRRGPQRRKFNGGQLALREQGPEGLSVRTASGGPGEELRPCTVAPGVARGWAGLCPCSGPTECSGCPLRKRTSRVWTDLGSLLPRQEYRGQRALASPGVNLRTPARTKTHSCHRHAECIYLGHFSDPCTSVSARRATRATGSSAGEDSRPGRLAQQEPGVRHQRHLPLHQGAGAPQPRACLGRRRGMGERETPGHPPHLPRAFCKFQGGFLEK